VHPQGLLQQRDRSKGLALMVELNPPIVQLVGAAFEPLPFLGRGLGPDLGDEDTRHARQPRQQGQEEQGRRNLRA
jgi:hypothetical protein